MKSRMKMINTWYNKVKITDPLTQIFTSTKRSINNRMIFHNNAKLPRHRLVIVQHFR